MVEAGNGVMTSMNNKTWMSCDELRFKGTMGISFLGGIKRQVQMYGDFPTSKLRFKH